MSADLKIRITTDARQSDAALTGTQGRVSALTGEVERTRRASEALTASFARMGHAAAAGLGAREVAQTADAWSNLNARLSLVAGSAAATAAAYDQVLKISLATRSSLEATGQIYEKFARQAGVLGISAQQIAGLTTSVTQAMTISGASVQSSEAALTQFGQALASGVLRGEELNSILEQAPRLAQALADGLNVPVGKLRELGEAGEITSQKLVDALTKQAATLQAEFSRMPLTIGGALTNVRTAWTDTVGSFEQSTGAFRGLAMGVQGVADNMGFLAGAAGAAAAVALGRLTASAYAGAAGMVAQAIATERAAQAAATSAAYFSGAGAAMGGMATASRLAGAAMGALGGPIGIVTTLLTLGVSAWAVWGDSAKNAADKARDAARGVAEEAAKLGLAELEVARRQRDAARSRWEDDGGGASSKHRAEWARLDDLVREMETREKNLAQAAAKAGAQASGKWGEFYATQAEQRAAEITKLNELYAAETAAAKDNQARQLGLAQEYQTKLATIRAKFDKAPSARGKSESDSGLDTLIRQAHDYAAALDYAAAHGGEKMSQAQKQLADALEKSGGKLSASNRALLEGNVAREKAAAVTQDAASAEAVWQKAQDESRAASEKQRDTLQEQVARQRAANAEIGLTADGLAALEESRLRDAIATAEQEFALRQKDGADLVELKAIDDQIGAYEQLIALKRDGAARQSIADEARRAAEEWKRFSDDIERSLTDALMRGFEAGDGFGKNFVSSLKNLLKTAALKVAVQAVVDPVMGGLKGALGGGSGGGSGLLGGLSSANSVYGMADKGLSYLGIGAGGTALGSSIASSWAAGAASSAAGSLSMGTAVSGLSTGTAVSGIGGLGAAAPVASGGTALAAIGAAAPYALAALAIADAVGLFGKRGGPQQGQYGSLSTKDGYSSSFTMSGGDALGNEKLSQAAMAQVGGLYALAGKTMGDVVLQQGYKLDPQGTAAGLAYRNLEIGGQKILGGTFDGNNGAQWRGANNDASGAATYLAKFTSNEIEKIAAAIDSPKLSEVVAKLKANFGDLASAMEKYAVAQTTKESLLLAVMTDEEREARTLEKSSAAVSAAFAQLGQTVPQSAAGFRELVSGLDLTTQAGQDTLAKLTGVSDAFLLVANTAKQVEADRLGWQRRLDVLEGDYTDKQLDRYMQLAGTSDTATKALMQQVWAMEDQAAAANTAADALRNMQAAALEGVNDAVDGLRSAYQADVDEKDRLVERMRAQVQKIRDFSQSLALGNLSTLDPLGKYDAARAAYEDVSRRASLGDQDAADQYQAVAQAFLQASRDYNASSASYAADYARVMASNDRIVNLSERQAIAIASQADVARAQLSALGTINASVNTVSSAIDRLQGALLEALRAGNIANVSSAAKQASGTITGRAGEQYNALTDTWVNKAGTETATSGDIKTWATNILGTQGEMGLYASAKAVGLSMPSLDTIMGWSVGTAEEWARQHGLPSFDVGTDYVPRTGLALIHKGERIIPAAQNRPVRDSDGGGQQTAQAIREGNGIARQGFGVLADKLDRMERRLAGLENEARLRGAA